LKIISKFSSHLSQNQNHFNWGVGLIYRPGPHHGSIKVGEEPYPGEERETGVDRLSGDYVTDPSPTAAFRYLEAFHNKSFLGTDYSTAKKTSQFWTIKNSESPDSEDGGCACRLRKGKSICG